MHRCLIYYSKCCNDIHTVIFNQTQDPISLHAKFVVYLLLWRGHIAEQAGESGVQLSVGPEMEAYGDQAAAASNQFCCKSREEPSRKPCDRQYRVIQLARPVQDMT